MAANRAVNERSPAVEEAVQGRDRLAGPPARRRCTLWAGIGGIEG
jgi:hypothetical protein